MLVAVRGVSHKLLRLPAPHDPFKGGTAERLGIGWLASNSGAVGFGGTVRARAGAGSGVVNQPRSRTCAGGQRSTSLSAWARQTYEWFARLLVEYPSWE